MRKRSLLSRCPAYSLIFLRYEVSRPFPTLAQSPVHWMSGDLYNRRKRPGRDAYCLPGSSAGAGGSGAIPPCPRDMNLSSLMEYLLHIF